MAARLIKEVVTIQPTSSKHTALVIFLHGSGDTGPNVKQWVLQLMGDMFSFPQHSVHFYTAPKRNYTVAGGFPMNVWFDRNFISDKAVEDFETLDPTARELVQVITKLNSDYSVPLSRTIVGGFSMGGSMSLFLGYKYLPQVAGVFAMSSFLSRSSLVYNSIKNKSPPHPPLFFYHGVADPLVQHHWAKNTCKNLESLGVDCNYHSMPGLDHALCVDELAKLREWILQILPNVE